MVSEKRILGNIIGHEKKEVTGRWRKLCKDEVQITCSSQINVNVVKLWRKRKKEHVTR
jgi:hypothetical protein